MGKWSWVWRVVREPRVGAQEVAMLGTVLEILAPGILEVEFSDDEGRTYASLALKADQLLALRYEPTRAD